MQMQLYWQEMIRIWMKAKTNTRLICCRIMQEHAHKINDFLLILRCVQNHRKLEGLCYNINIKYNMKISDAKASKCYLKFSNLYI